MRSESEQRLLILLALFGLLVWTVRVAPPASHVSVSLPEGAAESPRVALAHDMEIYELSVFDGSTYTLQAYYDVRHLCAQQHEDATVARACAIFDDALKHDSDRRAIDDAIRLLRDG
jgi:hypothetical protein